MPKKLRTPKTAKVAGEMKVTTKRRKDIVRSSPKTTHLDGDTVRSSPKTTHPNRIKNLKHYAHPAKLPSEAKIGVLKSRKSSKRGY
jgi:hypothetical protein